MHDELDEKRELDTELFDLCREVSQRTDWDTDELDYLLRLHKPNGMVTKVSAAGFVADTLRYAHKPETRRFNEENEVVALYTIDYLLGKLPRRVRSSPIELFVNNVGTWSAAYESNELDEDFMPGYCGFADTPLEALLKLVIALEDAKELS